MAQIIIKLENGKFVEQFYGASVLVTEDKNRAGKYSKKVAEERLKKHNITGELIPV